MTRTYRFVGAVFTTDELGDEQLVNRSITIDIGPSDQTRVAVMVPGRPQDDFSFHPGAWQSFGNVVDEIGDYITEQQRRIDTDHDSIARRANAQAILEGGAS